MSKMQVNRKAAFAPIDISLLLTSELEAREFALALNKTNRTARMLRERIVAELGPSTSEGVRKEEPEFIPYMKWFSERSANLSYQRVKARIDKKDQEEEEIPFTPIQQWLKHKEEWQKENVKSLSELIDTVIFLHQR